MLKIKLTTAFPYWPVVRQTPGSKGIWGNCQFFENQDIEECDFWVVFGGLLQLEKTLCPPENTVLITAEPPTVKRYSEKFLRQFATVITCHRGIKHPNVIYAQQALPWHIGADVNNHIFLRSNKDYDEMRSITEYRKTKLMSVISSSKSFTGGHVKRREFVERLKAHFGDKLDVFGYGVQDIEDKWDAIADYKYHLALENCAVDDYWTEKLSDTFLGGAYPLYHGCPNIFDYFPEGSLRCIDIGDFESSISVIEDAVQNHEYEKSVDKIYAAKDLVLDKYNLFPMLCKLFDGKGANRDRLPITIMPEYEISRSYASKARKVIGLLAGKVRNKLLKIDKLPQGYFSIDDVVAYRNIIKSLNDDSTIAEIGVWRGRSLASVADLILKKNIRVVAIDTFKGSDCDVGKDELKKAVVKEHMEEAQTYDIYEEFKQNMEKFGLLNNVVILKSKSAFASKTFADGYFDFIFIDADHSYKSVVEDITSWSPKVKLHGIIGGHDYSTWESVKKAVNDICGEHNIMTCNPSSIWIKRKES